MNDLYRLEDDLKDARKDALTTIVKDYTIDTCYCFDTGEWETGICKEGDLFIIVEVYENKKEAVNRHKYWCKYIKENENIDLSIFE